MTEDEIDFDLPFMSDDEVEGMLDGLVLSVGQEIVEEESRTAIINPVRMKEIATVYKVLQYLCKGTKSKVSYTLHQPFQSVGCVTVIGKDLVFKHSEWFVKACGLASNIDIYPRTDGTVRLDLTFHGLTKPIE